MQQKVQLIPVLWVEDFRICDNRSLSASIMYFILALCSLLLKCTLAVVNVIYGFVLLVLFEKYRTEIL